MGPNDSEQYAVKNKAMDLLANFGAYEGQAPVRDYSNVHPSVWFTLWHC